MSENEPGFSIGQVNEAQRLLRNRAGLPEERFPLPALIGMLSDEIEALHRAGHDDAAIADLIGEATGTAIQPNEVTAHYAGPERRARS